MNCNKFIPLIRSALKEDIGRRDITTELIIPKDKAIKAVLSVKEDCVVCGLDIARLVFKAMDKRLKFKPLARDGQYVKKGKILARIEGHARPILTAERVALNFVSLVSGIATRTKEYVEAVSPYRVKIMDTRKTIPGLRELEKYAVRIGGGYNHRMRLDEMILIKDNHLRVIGSEVQKFRSLKMPKGVKTEIEVNNLKEFREALKLKPDIIMLDNMGIEDIRGAVKIKNSLQLKLEASGEITLKNIRKVAATGVDMISIGDLTHSVESIDISLEII